MERLLIWTGMVVIARCLVGCCGALCVDQMKFEIHLAAGRPALEGGTLTICQTATCSSGTPVWKDVPMSGWQEATIALTGALSVAKVTLVVTPDERTTIEAEVWPKGNRNVDHYDVQFVDAQGTTRLDFSRDQGYDRYDLCGKNCITGRVRVWATSPNDLTCTSRTCDSGALFTSTLILPAEFSQPTPFEICRNDTCSKHDSLGRRVEGSLSAQVALESLGKNSFKYSLRLEDDPAVLADGDLYRLTVTDFQQGVLVTTEATASYTESFPNGPTCDPHPCRWATLAP